MPGGGFGAQNRTKSLSKHCVYVNYHIYEIKPVICRYCCFMARCHVTHLSEPTSSLDESTSSQEGQISSRVSVPFGVVEPLFVAADITVIVGAGALGGVLYQLALDGSCGDARFYIGLGLVVSLAHVFAAHCFGLYRLNEMLAGEQDDGRVWTSWSIAILVLVVILFLFKAGAQVPVMGVALVEEVGNAVKVAPEQIAGIAANVGVTFGLTVMVNVAGVAH